MSFQFHFHFSKKSEGILFFTFHFSKKVKAIHISLFFLEKKEWNQVRAITSPLSLFPIVFPKIVKSQVSTSLKILAKFQFQNLDQTLCSKSEPNISLKKVTKNSTLISWPNFSFYTKLWLIRSSSTLTCFQLTFLHTKVTSVKFGTVRQTRQCNDRTWIW